MAFGSLASSAGLCQGASHSALWLPLDFVLEDVMDGYQVDSTSAVERISGKGRFFNPSCSIPLYKSFFPFLFNNKNPCKNKN